MAKLLDEVYEVRFLDCSYGFQKGKNCHDVVRYINQTVMTKKVNYVLEADIKGFIDNVNHEWLMRFLNFDIADRRFLRYVRRFLIAGVIEDGAYLESDRGTSRGGLISPVQANVYLAMAIMGLNRRDKLLIRLVTKGSFDGRIRVLQRVLSSNHYRSISDVSRHCFSSSNDDGGKRSLYF